MAADFAVNWVNELFCHTQSTQELFLCIWTFEKKRGGWGQVRFFYNMQFFFYLMEILVLLYMQLNRMVLPNSVHSWINFKKH